MASFLESAGVALFAAFFAAGWHSLSRNGKPDARELAIGIDLIVSAMVLQFGFIPGSHGSAAEFRWAGVFALCVILMVMALIVRMRGYEKSADLFWRVGEGKSRRYRPADQMKAKAAVWTSVAGGAILCLAWWSNLHIGLVVAAWKGMSH